MVADHVYPVAIAKVCLKTTTYWQLNASCETQIMITRQTRYDSSAVATRSLGGRPVSSLFQKDVREAVILFLPERAAIAVVAFFWTVRQACSPLTTSIEQISKEEDCMWVEVTLDTRVGPAKVDVRMLDREGGQGPWPIWIGMRVDELGIRYKGDAMRCCT